MGICVVECTCGRRMCAPEEALGGHGTCVHCGARIRLSDANVWRPVANAAQCVRCGHAFRGDWDRTETTVGSLCQQCARLYEPPPEMAPAEPVYANEPVAPVLTERETPVLEEPEEEPKSRKGLLLYLLFSAVALAIYAALPVDEPIRELMALLTPERPDVPQGSWLERMFVISVLVSVLYHFAALYLGLLWCGLLPNEDTRNNVIAVGAMAAVLFLIGLIGINPFLLVGCILVRLMLIAHVYDMGARDLGRYIIVALMLLPLAPMLESLLYGLIAIVAY